MHILRTNIFYKHFHAYGDRYVVTVYADNEVKLICNYYSDYRLSKEVIEEHIKNNLK